MKTIHQLGVLIVTFALSVAAYPAEKIAAGPKGGRWLPATPLAAEFFVNAARRVEITFYDAARQPAAPGTQTVNVTAEVPSGSVRLELEPSAHGFTSLSPLPAGEPYRVVVQVRPEPGARPQNFRIDLNLAGCAECQHAEYACTCEGH